MRLVIHTTCILCLPARIHRTHPFGPAQYHAQDLKLSCCAQEHHVTLEGAVVHVSLHPGATKSVISFAVGPPVLVEFSADVVKQLPAFIMGGSVSLYAARYVRA